MSKQWAEDHGEIPMTRRQFEAEEARAKLEVDAEKIEPDPNAGRRMEAIIALLVGKLEARRSDAADLKKEQGLK